MKINGKVYRTVVRSALMYGAETWALKKAQENKLEVAEMRMCGVTKLDKIRNERIRGTTKVGEITKKVQERRLKWYGQVMRREEHYVGRRAIEMKVHGRRNRERPKRRWLDKVDDDIKEKGLSADQVYDRATWRHMSSNIDPTYRWEYDEGEEEVTRTTNGIRHWPWIQITYPSDGGWAIKTIGWKHWYFDKSYIRSPTILHIFRLSKAKTSRTIDIYKSTNLER